MTKKNNSLFPRLITMREDKEHIDDNDLEWHLGGIVMKALFDEDRISRLGMGEAWYTTVPFAGLGDGKLFYLLGIPARMDDRDPYYMSLLEVDHD